VILGLLFFVDRASSDYRFDPGHFTLSPWIVWPLPITIGLILGVMAWRVAAIRKQPLQVGATAILGARGKALGEVGPEGGQVFVVGEYWQARSATPIPAGAAVRVTALNGLVLTVEPDPNAPELE